MVKKEVEENIDTELRLYELGFHFLPTIAETEVPALFTKVKDLIEGYGGMVGASEMPKTVSLAYRIPKVITNKRTFYHSAYFGWIRFNMFPEKALACKIELSKNENILRFILLKVTLEKVFKESAPRMTFIPTRRTLPKAEEEKVPETKLSEAELDKTIEELMVN